MAISTDDVKKLREETGISVMQCKSALEEAGGDMEKARIILAKKSKAAAAKKSDRDLGAGTVASYIHAGGTVGGMIELLCETDFVARNEDFQKLAYDIAMQVAASEPAYLTSEEINDEEKAKVAEVLKKEVEDKPADMQEQILEGKLDAFFKERVLMNQTYIKDPKKTVKQLIEEATQKFGERTEIGRFSRFSI